MASRGPALSGIPPVIPPGIAPAQDQAQVPNAVGNDQVPLLPAGGGPQALQAMAAGAEGQLLPPVMQHTSFATLFCDEARDPFRHSYAAIVERFNAMNARPLTGEALLESALGNPSVPNTFLCCSNLNTGTGYRVYLLHSLSKYIPSLDGRITPWDSRIFCFLGEVIQETAVTVAIPATAFGFTPQTYIYNDDTLVTELPNLQNGQLFPRLGNNENSTLMRTRYLMYLPTKYAHLLLDNKGYTPHEAWNRLVPAFQNDDLLQAAAPIIMWLRATLHSTQNNNHGPPITALALVAPIADQDLVQHRHTVLYSTLPRLRERQDVGLNTAIIQMANAVATQANEARSARLAKEAERDQPTLPSVKFNLLFNNLKNYLNVQDEVEFPEFWFSLAAAKKKQEFGVVRDTLDAYARSDNAFIALAPIPTPKLVADLTTITFVSDHPDDLKTGLQPFIAMDGSEEYRLAAQNMAQTYNMLSERDYHINYADLDQFKVPKDLRAHPTTFFELEKSLGIFGNLMGTILGEGHPLTTHYRSFWLAFTKQFRNQLHFEIDVRKVIKPVHVLRNVQLIVFHWFQAKKCSLIPSTPPFQDILTRISLSLYINPTLPSALYHLVTSRPGPKLSMVIDKPPPNSDDATTATGISTISGSAAASSVISGLTLGSGTQGSGTQGSGRSGAFIRNPTVDTSLQGLLIPGVRITDLVGSDPVPSGEDNNPICLAYHIRGGCYSNCRRRANHERALTPTDKQKLSNWLVDQTAKLRAKFAAN